MLMVNMCPGRWERAILWNLTEFIALQTSWVSWKQTQLSWLTQAVLVMVGLLLVFHHHAFTFWELLIDSVVISLQGEATGKTLMWLPGRKTCRKSAERDWSKQVVQTGISFALFSGWREFWSCMCWATRCRNIWSGWRSILALAMLSVFLSRTSLGTKVLFHLMSSNLLEVNTLCQVKGITII